MGFWNQVIKGRIFKAERFEVTNHTLLDDKTINQLAAQIIPEQLMWSKDLCIIVPRYTKGNFRIPFMKVDNYGTYIYYDSEINIEINSLGTEAEINIYGQGESQKKHLYTIYVNGSS